MDIEFLTAADLSRLIASRALSPVEVVRHLLDRITHYDAGVNAFITVTADRALEDARSAEREIAAGRRRGPLHGLPYALKDIYDTAGVATTGHSRIGMGHVPHRSATTVRLLQDAGAILLGKLATFEYAHGGHSELTPWPAPRNPWNPAHATGGSSSGSAAAVAAGFVPFALGSDTGGSIRIPAALTGVAGLKPTYGLVSRAGVVPNAYSLDHCGPLARTVEDCALVLDAIAAHDPADPASVTAPRSSYCDFLMRDLSGLRVGLVRHLYERDVDVGDEARAALSAAVDVLRSLGAVVSDAQMKPARDYDDLKVIIGETEIYAVHEAQLKTRLGDFGQEFLNKTLAGALFTGADYLQAQRRRRQLMTEMHELYASFDVLVTACTGPAPELGVYRVVDAWKKPTVYTPFSITAGPALVVCNGFSKSGLPLAMQIVGRPFDEASVLRAAHAYEQATEWRMRHPGLRDAARSESPKARQDLPKPDPLCLARVAESVRAAQLTLSDAQLQQLALVAPYALEMAARVHRAYPRELEPATVLRCG